MSTDTTPFEGGTADPLSRLRDRLIVEYADEIPPKTIERAAAQALHELSDARVREFVPVFAWRRACARLRSLRG
jgi:hypothetical protein